MACVEVQASFKSGSLGVYVVFSWLSIGRVYLSEIVSEFGPLRGPRRRDNLTHWLISTQVRRRLRAEVPLGDGLAPAGAVRLSH